MDRDAVRSDLRARARRVRADLEAEWGEAPRRRHVVPATQYDPPGHPDEVFPWAAVCFVRRDEAVLVLRDDDHDALAWEPPGGRGEPGETPAETARREVREETGVRCEVSELLCVDELRFDYGDDDHYPVSQAVFAARYVDGEARANEPDIDAVEWVSRADPPANLQYRDLLSTR